MVRSCLQKNKPQDVVVEEDCGRLLQGKTYTFPSVLGQGCSPSSLHRLLFTLESDFEQLAKLNFAAGAAISEACAAFGMMLPVIKSLQSFSKGQRLELSGPTIFGIRTRRSLVACSLILPLKV